MESKGSTKAESCVTKSATRGVFPCRLKATAPAIAIAPAEQRRSLCVMRPWSCAVRTKSSKWSKKKGQLVRLALHCRCPQMAVVRPLHTKEYLGSADLPL